MDCLTIQYLTALGIHVPEKYFGYRVEPGTKNLIGQLKQTDREGILRDSRNGVLYQITNQVDISDKVYFPPIVLSDKLKENLTNNL